MTDIQFLKEDGKARYAVVPIEKKLDMRGIAKTSFHLAIHALTMCAEIAEATGTDLTPGTPDAEANADTWGKAISALKPLDRDTAVTYFRRGLKVPSLANEVNDITNSDSTFRASAVGHESSSSAYRANIFGRKRPNGVGQVAGNLVG